MRKKQHRKDFYAKKAKQEGYQSRAAYKLEQIHKKFRIFTPNQVVIDLCGAPGGWSQIAKLLIGEKGEVLLIDLQRVNLKGIHSIQADITSEDIYVTIKNYISDLLAINDTKSLLIDIVLADCSPNVSGAWTTDHARQIWLAENAFKIASSLLTQDGVFVCKVFDGDLFKEFISTLRDSFKMVKIWKPEASRKESAEIYVICRNLMKKSE